MPEYRFFAIMKDGHIGLPPVDLELPDDHAAVSKARKLLNGHDIEIWEGKRVVAYLVPDND